MVFQPRSPSRSSDKLRSSALPLGAAALAAYAGWRMWQRLDEMELAGKVVLITGGSRGLGLAMAREFGKAGAQVVICARDWKELAAAAADLDERGIEGRAVRCDVSDYGQISRMVRRITNRFGGIDVVVNNAGIVQVGPVGTMTLEDFRETMEVNFWGAVHTTRAALPGMLERGEGRIVNITSMGGKVAVPRLLPYDCAKFALVGFSEGLRAELFGSGVAVTTVVPGLMRTGGPVNAIFKGDPDREFSWFSATNANPLATSAKRAARRIVRAARRGEAEVTLTWQAKLLRLAHLLPGSTANRLGLANHLLPTKGDATAARHGMDLATRTSPSVLTWPLDRAALDLNQYGGQVAPSPEHARRVGFDRIGRRGERPP